MTSTFKMSYTTLKYPCEIDCPNRSATCHCLGECPEYTEYWKAREAEKKKNAKLATDAHNLNMMDKTRKDKRLKRERRMKG